MKTSILGLGYEAVVVGTWFGSAGYQTSFWDREPVDMEEVLAGETGLQALLNLQHKNGSLSYEEDIREVLKDSELCFLPMSAFSGLSKDSQLWQLNSTLEVISKHMNPASLLVLFGSIPPGTYEHVRGLLQAHQREDILLASHPTFFRQGHAISDISSPKKVIIGSENPKALSRLKFFYQTLLKDDAQIISISPNAAELSRFAAHAREAVEISFFNELAGLCERMNLDFEDVSEGMKAAHTSTEELPAVSWKSKDKMVMDGALELIESAKNTCCTMEVLNAAREIDKRAPNRLVRQLQQLLGRIGGKRIAVWGLTQNSGTGSLEDSFSCSVIRSILSAGGEVVAYDPVARIQARKMFKSNVKIVEEPYEALKDADVLVIGTGWNMFKNLDHSRMVGLMRSPMMIDACRLLSTQSSASESELSEMTTETTSSGDWELPVQYLSDDCPTQVDLLAGRCIPILDEVGLGASDTGITYDSLYAASLDISELKVKLPS